MGSFSKQRPRPTLFVPDGKEHGLLVLPALGGGAVEVVLPPSHVLMLLALFDAYREDRDTHAPSRGWRTRKELAAAYARLNGVPDYPLELDTVTRYLMRIEKRIQAAQSRTGRTIDVWPVERHDVLGARLRHPGIDIFSGGGEGTAPELP